MGSYDSLAGIVVDIKKFLSYGMTVDEINQILEDDGVADHYRRSAFRRATVS